MAIKHQKTSTCTSKGTSNICLRFMKNPEFTKILFVSVLIINRKTCLVNDCLKTHTHFRVCVKEKFYPRPVVECYWLWNRCSHKINWGATILTRFIVIHQQLKLVSFQELYISVHTSALAVSVKINTFLDPQSLSIMPLFPSSLYHAPKS